MKLHLHVKEGANPDHKPGLNSGNKTTLQEKW